MSGHRYASAAEFRAVHPPERKWDALVRAATRAFEDPRFYARSIGPLLTYWSERASSPDPGTPLRSSQMFQTALLAGPAPVAVAVAPVAELEALDRYDDTSDTQEFAPPTGTPLSTLPMRITLQPGELLLLDPAAAWRLAPVDPAAPTAPTAPAADPLVHVFRLTRSGPPPRPSLDVIRPRGAAS